MTSDDGTALCKFIVAYGDPEYPVVKVFRNPKNVDIVFAIGDPDTTPLMDSLTQAPYGYRESIPITAFCIDKFGITANKLKWKAEAELRRVAETYPTGSLRRLEHRRDTTTDLGPTRMYGFEFKLTYERDTST